MRLSIPVLILVLLAASLVAGCTGAGERSTPPEGPTVQPPLVEPSTTASASPTASAATLAPLLAAPAGIPAPPSAATPAPSPDARPASPTPSTPSAPSATADPTPALPPPAAASPTPVPAPVVASIETATATATPTAESTPEPTSTATATAVAAAAATPVPIATATPVATATATPTVTPTVTPAGEPDGLAPRAYSAQAWQLFQDLMLGTPPLNGLARWPLGTVWRVYVVWPQLVDEHDMRAIRSALWTLEAATGLGHEFVASAEQADVRIFLGFDRVNPPPDYPFPAGSLEPNSAATDVFGWNGHIVHADVIIPRNARLGSAYRDFTRAERDNVIAHELGHVAGVRGHSADPAHLMSYAVDPAVTTFLPVELEAIALLYDASIEPQMLIDEIRARIVVSGE